MNKVGKGIKKKPAYTATLGHLVDPKVTVRSFLTRHCIHVHK